MILREVQAGTHTNHISMLTEERDVDAAGTRLQAATSDPVTRRIELFNHQNRLDAIILSHTVSAGSFNSGQALLCMAVSAAQTVEESTQYMQDFMVRRMVQASTEHERSKFLVRLSDKRTVARWMS